MTTAAVVKPVTDPSVKYCDPSQCPAPCACYCDEEPPKPVGCICPLPLYTCNRMCICDKVDDVA